MIKIPKNLANKKALTLIEILLAIIILGIVMTIATTIIIQTFGIVGSSSSRMSTKQLTALAEDRIEKYLQTAINDVNNNFGDEQLQWKFKGYSDVGDEIEYIMELRNNQLVLKIGDKAEEVILNNVDDFYIEKLNNNGIFKLHFEVEDDSNLIINEKIVAARNY